MIDHFGLQALKCKPGMACAEAKKILWLLAGWRRILRPSGSQNLHTDRQTDRQIDRQTDRQTDR